MNLLANLTSQGLEESTDRLGGFSALETDIYTGKVKVAYLGKSSGGATSITVIAMLGDKEFRSTQYVTNKKGENWFLNKNDPTKKVPLPGFTIIDDLCLCTTGKPLSEQSAEEKMLNIYDADAKKEIPKAVNVLVELIGADVSLAIEKVIVDKNVKNAAGDYVPTGETREENEVAKVFNADQRLTVAEARAGETQPKFWDAWLERNKGKTRDKTDKSGGAAGAPTKGKPVSAGAAAAPRTSLFGKK